MIAEQDVVFIFCYYCGKVLNGRRDKSKDHIIPVSKYGNNEGVNKVDCCRSCNELKGSLTLEKFYEEVRLKVVGRRRKKRILSNIKLLIQFRDNKQSEMKSPTLIGLYTRKKQRKKRLKLNP